jgi:hypothetical protein
MKLDYVVIQSVPGEAALKVVMYASSESVRSSGAKYLS